VVNPFKVCCENSDPIYELFKITLVFSKIKKKITLVTQIRVDSDTNE